MAPPPSVSVITPFYNTAAYLAQSIESVLAQTWCDFEYILVDNHSTDGSADIAHDYAQRDHRIRVVQPPEFVRQVPNYNFALEQIAPDSRWCKIVQADDWIFPRCLTEMVALGDEFPSIGLISAYELQEDKVRGDYLHPDVRMLPGREAARLNLLRSFHMFGSPTTVMYRADLVRARQPFYELDRLHEDTEVVFELLRQADFGFVHQVLTFTRQQDGSLMSTMRENLTQKLDEYIVVSRYGREFLAEDEFQRCHSQRESAYYQALARRRMKYAGRKDAAFWEYQRRGLATIGADLDVGRIARQAVPGLLDRVRHGRAGS